MAIVSKKKPVAANTSATPKTPAVEKKVVNSTKKITVQPPKKAAPVAAKKTDTKKLTLNGNPKTPKSFEIKEGSQATQDAFIDRFYKKFLDLGYDVTKEQVKAVKKAYSETLKEVTDIASYHDVDAGMYYARRYIKTRVTEPPKAKNGLKTLMNGHYEIKVRKLLGNEEEFKFFGDVNDDGTIFITEDGTEIALTDEEEVEVKPVVKTKKAVKKAPVVEEEEIVEEVEEEEIDEVEEEEIEDEDDEFDDFLDDEE